jgi:membrane protease YdiL (CAAX protease family)
MIYRAAVERHPFRFSFLLILLLVLVQAAGVVVGRRVGLPASGVGAFTEFVLALILVSLVSGLRWWSDIGFRKPKQPADLLVFLPALALPIGNLTFGVAVTQLSALLSVATLAIASGFVEEVIFRGLILRAFAPSGQWKALFTSTVLFGFVHAFNVFAGHDPVYAALQVGYALAIGFGFGAMALKSRLLWPLALVHGLGNFIALINDGQVGPYLFVILALYIALFVGYGLYLMLRDESKRAAGLLVS